MKNFPFSMFQHTAARRRLQLRIELQSIQSMFQHTAARRRLRRKMPFADSKSSFNTQPPEGGCLLILIVIKRRERFNTQPPEGGCNWHSFSFDSISPFQHTAARRRLHCGFIVAIHSYIVSTHSRPKAAAYLFVTLTMPR